MNSLIECLCAQIGPAEEAIEQETMEVLNLVVLDNPVAKGRCCFAFA